MEETSDTRLFIIKSKVADQIKDEYHERGTLMDRYYDLTRYGVSGKGPVSYVLKPKDPSEPGEACAKVLAELRPLEEVVLEEFSDTAPQAASAAPAPTPTTPDPDEEIDFS
jgi:hypothetical protein